MIRTSVILLTRNNASTLDEVLTAIFSQLTADEFEVIHIDSNSTDDTRAIVDRYPCRRYQISPADFSHSGTRNQAAELSRGEYVVYLSADATPADPRWLERLIAPLNDPSVAGVFGRQVPRAGASAVESYFLQRMYPGEGRTKRVPAGERLTLKDLFFSNVTSAIRKSVWAQHPFDEQLYMCEDQAWARDVLKAGFTLVYEPDAAVVHSHNYDLARLFRRNFDTGHSFAVLLRGHDIRFLGYGTGYVTRVLLDFARMGRVGELPYVALYELVRGLAFYAGRQAPRLPPRLRAHCSDYKFYWERFDQALSAATVRVPAEPRA